MILFPLPVHSIDIARDMESENDRNVSSTIVRCRGKTQHLYFSSFHSFSRFLFLQLLQDNEFISISWSFVLRINSSACRSTTLIAFCENSRSEKKQTVYVFISRHLITLVDIRFIPEFILEQIFQKVCLMRDTTCRDGNIFNKSSIIIPTAESRVLEKS